MTRKVYRTAQGKLVDLGALQLRNENVRAVGNMGVNARGDLIDGNNRPIDTKSQQARRLYNRQITNVENVPVAHKTKPAPQVEIPTPPEDFDDDFALPAEPATAPAAQDEPKYQTVSGTTGLAAAIAKSRQVKQELLQPATRNKRQLRKI